MLSTARLVMMLNVCSAALPMVPALAQSSETPAAAPAAAPKLEIAVGDPGKRFALSEARGRFVALHFLLLTECPVCVRTAQDYIVRADEVAGVTHVFIKPDDVASVDRFRAMVGAKLEGVGGDPERLAGLPIYRDADAALARQLGVKDGYAFHNATMHFPATIIFDREGREAFRFTGNDNTQRLTFDAFRQKIKELDNPPEAREGLSEKGVAVEGYDVVAYFDGKPAKGQESMTSQYQGRTYRFASAASRARFAADPASFAPQYGGWCAYAMADGDKVEIDPKTFKIFDGKLYLFYNGLLGNTLKSWNKAEAALKPKADSAWVKLTSAK